MNCERCFKELRNGDDFLNGFCSSCWEDVKKEIKELNILEELKGGLKEK